LPTVNLATTDGGFTWNATFSGAGVVGGSIADGSYDVTLNAAVVHLVASPATTMASNYLTNFYRIYGDITGNGAVNNADYNQFKLTFGSSSAAPSGPPPYNVAFDYDGNGFVNNADYNQFKLRFGTLWTSL